jgi:hypothetical protein
MGVSAGPKIVTNGLILNLNIANRKSYSKNSILPLIGWTTGSGGTTYFGQNGDTVENERVYAIDPWGNSSVVWETRASGNGEADGGWNTSWFDIDNTKLYRFSSWMRRTSSSSGGTFYHGLYGTGGTFGVRRLDSGTIEGNSYWECVGTGNFTQNQWYLYVGHCYPHTTTYTGRHPNSGYYDTTGTKFNWGGCNVGNDVKWLPDSTQTLLRNYHYYCADNTTRLQFYAPRIDLCDGTEPSLKELLELGPDRIKDQSLYGNHHALGAYNIPTADNPRRFQLDGANLGIIRNGALNGVTNNCTVVIYYKTTDTQELWVRGNQNNSFYLSASASNNYYHANVGSPTNFVDLNTVVRPDSPVNYRNGAYHMWEAKGVDFSSWTYFDWFLYPGGWQMAGDVSKILVYNRSITSDESAQNFYALRSRYGI